ncbi:MAG: hypothetical protein H6664_15375 [Ardenticatenaceae bacterium]|nr:hypothetical protein [Ardenticatenaceae bacterium]
MSAKFIWKLITIILIFAFSSCSMTDNDVASLSISTVQHITPVPKTISDLWTSRSPNGEWDAYLSPLITTAVITSTSSRISFEDNFEVGSYNSIVSWFPDNSGFIVFDANQGCSHCSYDRLTIYHIIAPTNEFSHFEFHPLLEPNTALPYQPISWSFDGLQFAIIVGEFNSEQIYILDRYANVIRVIEPQLSDEETIDQVIWAEESLIYSVRNLSGIAQSTEVRMINLNKQVTTEAILRRESDHPRILSVSPGSDYLLISTLRISVEPSLGEIGVFDIKNRRFVNTIYQFYGDEYPYFDYLESDNRQIVGLQLYNKGDTLFVYDWNTQELVDTKVTIDALLGWRDDQNSFIVLRSNKLNNPIQWIELLPYK